MHTSSLFFLENALLNFPPNFFSILALEVFCCWTFDCAILSLLTMTGKESSREDTKYENEEVIQTKTTYYLPQNACKETKT